MSSRSTPSSSTGTLTLTLETPESRPSNPQPRNLVLRLRPPKNKVTWEEGTVDNEFLNRKSSKKCCIFHKQKPFDEDASEDEGDEGGEGDRAGPSGGGSCSSHACRS